MADWQYSCKEVKERGAQILKSGQWADCTFVVGRDQEKGTFAAHKLFLAMASPVFDSMLNGPLAEEGLIEIPDARPESFKTLLEYIYTDQFKIDSCSHACDLYYCAAKYILPHLAEKCIQYIRNNLTPQNVCQVFEFSEMFDETTLYNECLELIILKTKEVINDPSFLDIEPSTVKKILRYNLLNVDGELDLFFAVDNYLKYHTKSAVMNEITNCDAVQDDQVNITSSDAKSEKDTECPQPLSTSSPSCTESEWDNYFAQPENEEGKDRTSNLILRTLIQELRLLSLTAQEFSENVALSPFITQSESFALLMNINSGKCGVPIPKGFNTSYKPRYELETNYEYILDPGWSPDKNRSETRFNFVISNFSERMVMSLPIYVGGVPWRIAVNPEPGNDKNMINIRVYLFCCWVDKSPHWSRSAKAEIRLVSLTIDPYRTKPLHMKKSIQQVFKSNWGSDVLFESIEASKDSSLTIEVHIAAKEPINIT